MTKRCTLKEAFIEKMLDKFQPSWRNGENITEETKEKIKEYVASKVPKGLKEEAECITNYSIWHMAKKIRERENLPHPQKSNVGSKRKVSVCKSTDGGIAPAPTNSEGKKEQSYKLKVTHTINCDAGSEPQSELADEIRKLINKFGFDAVMSIIATIKKELKEGTLY